MNIITLDLDRAPDHEIRIVADILADKGVPATWLVTHTSEAVQELIASPLFEVGIHPDFVENSQGATVEAVLDHCFSIAPKAVTCRTHCLFQSHYNLELLYNRGIKYDLSLMLPHQHRLEPHKYYFDDGGYMVRLPTYFMDRAEANTPLPRYDAEYWLGPAGLKVYCFHPQHVAKRGAVRDMFEAVCDRIANTPGVKWSVKDRGEAFEVGV